MKLEYKKGQLNANELNAKDVDKINVGIKSGIYFLFSNKDELLYVGKSKNINDRLKKHLVRCNVSTSSKIQEVLDYLLSL